MDIAAMIADIRRRPDFRKAGMLLSHNGVVRGHARDGRRVRGLRVASTTSACSGSWPNSGSVRASSIFGWPSPRTGISRSATTS